LTSQPFSTDKARPARPATPADGCAWITGASSGIGAAVARRLAAEGWRVAISARRAPALAELARQVAADGPGRLVPFPLDVTDLEQVRTGVAAIEAELGPIALTLLNAGTYRPDSALDLSSAAVREQVDLNLMGTVHCLEVLVPRLVARGQGQLAVVASIAGYRGLPRAIAYSATKAGLIALTESLWFDLEPRGIKVQLVMPGFVRTPLTDLNDFEMPFLMEVDDAAAALVRGLAGRRFEIRFPALFGFLMRRLTRLPYGLYFPLVARGTRR